MKKYKLLLDESGTFDKNGEKYIIIGGVYFCVDDQYDLEQIFFPLHHHLCKALNIDELHGSKDKELFKYIAPIIGSIKTIHPIIFVIDKKETFIFSKYNKKSFKYNKAIEHLVRKMVLDKLIKKTDELYIKIDNISLSEIELDNLSNHLPRNFPFIKEVSQDDSRNNICLQLADIIVNRFSKKQCCKLSDKEMRLLNPKVYCFLSETERDYIKE